MRHKDPRKAALRTRIKQVKTRLPFDWKEQLLQKYPEYDTFAMGHILRNVYSGAQAPTDELCERIEALALPEIAG